MSGRSSARARAFVLMAPLILFLLTFFVWPLWSMFRESVADTAVIHVLPLTAEAVDGWDRASPPTPEMEAALVADLRAATDEQAVGDMTRRLNSAQSGFRTLMSKTLKAVRDPEIQAVVLAEVDKRWQKPEYWIAISDALSPWTDRNLLAAVDMERDKDGNVVTLPSDASANRAIIGRTLWISGLVTLFTLAIGLPYAMAAASLGGWKRNVLLVAVLLPLWTSLLVRTAAWYILLQDSGLINTILQALHITDGPIALIFNRVGVVIAMTHVLLPFMVLPIYSVLISLPSNLMPAASSLGAPPLRAFWRVLLPLSLRGVASGALLVFMSAIGYYITPALIGGAGDQMISSVIAFYATGSANWGMASALGIVLLVLTLALYAVYGRLSREQVYRS